MHPSNHDDGGSVKERLARMETKIDSLCANKDDSEKRIRSLERHRWIQHGGLALLTVVFKDKLVEVAAKIFKP
jgi:hypothetical protein